MPVQDDKSFSGCSCQMFQSPGQFHIFSAKRFVAEAPETSERCRFDENQRAGEHSPPAEAGIHEGRQQFDEEKFLIPTDGRAPGDAVAGLDFLCHVGEHFRAGMGISIHEHQPVAGGGRRT